MRWKPPTELGDALLVAAGVLVLVALGALSWTLPEPQKVAAQNILYAAKK
jgi:hypothetical protein